MNVTNKLATLLVLFLTLGITSAAAASIRSASLTPDYTDKGISTTYTFTVTPGDMTQKGAPYSDIVLFEVQDQFGSIQSEDVSLISPGGASVSVIDNDNDGTKGTIQVVKDDISDGTTVKVELTVNSPSAERTYTPTVKVRDNLGTPVSTQVTTKVDDTAPTVSSAKVTAADKVTLTFGEGVYTNSDGSGNLGTTDFSYNDASGDGASGISSVSHTAGDSTVTITLSPEIDNSDLSTDEINIEADSIYDLVGNTVSSTAEEFADGDTDDVAPSITGASIASSSSSGDTQKYVAGDTITVDVSYDENVQVTGTPKLDLGAVKADYSSGSGSSTLTFLYTVQDGDSGDLTLGDISLNGGTLEDTAGNNAETTSSTESIQTASIDTNAPQNPSTTTITTAPINIGNENSVTVDVEFSSSPESGKVKVQLSDEQGNNVTAETSANTNGEITSVTGIDVSSLNDGQIKAKAKIVDDAGNPNQGGFTATSNSVTRDTQAPKVTSIKTFDTEPNGQLDGVTVTYSEDVKNVGTDDITVDADWTISGASETSDGVVDYIFQSEQGDTATTPSVNFNTANIRDINGNDLASGQDATATDNAAPVPLDAQTEYLDTDADGDVERIDIQFSEDISSSTLEKGDFTLSGGDASSLSKDSVNIDSDDGKDEVELSVSGYTGDTDLGAITVDYTQTRGTGDSLTDGLNPVTDFSGQSISDGAAPQIMDVEVTEPSKVQASFSEQVDGASGADEDLKAGDFEYNGDQSVSSVSETGLTSTATLTLGNEVDNSDLGTDTVDVASSSVYDSADNAAPEGQDVTVKDDNADDVAPSITSAISATESGSDVSITFSADEKLSSIDVDIGSATLTSNDFSESSSGPYTYTATYTPGSDGSYTATLDQVGDGTNTISPDTSDSAIVDTTGPSFGSATTTSTTSVQVTLKDADSKVNVNSIEAGDFEIGGNAVSSISNFGSSDASSLQGTLTVDSSNSFSTGATPNVEIVSGASGIADTRGNTKTSQTFSSTNDGVKPVVNSATAEDTDGNGHLDKITLTLSEGLTSNNPSTSAFTVKDSEDTTLTVEGVAAGDGSSTTDYSSSSKTVVLELGDSTGTTGQPTVSYTSGKTTEVKDDASTPNKLADASPTVTDDAKPVAMSASYTDTGTDGTVDQMTVTFSEKVSAKGTVDGADFTLSGGDLSGGDTKVSGTGTPTVSTTSTVTVSLDTSDSDLPSGDTALGTVSASYDETKGSNSGGLKDGSSGSNNVLSSATISSGSVSDNAAPQITGVEVTAPSKVQASFSEQVDGASGGSGDLVAADFQYGGSQSVSSVSETGLTTTATLTLDNEVDNSDLGTDTVDVASSVYDSADNVAPTGQDVTVKDDTNDNVAPSITSASTMDKDNNGQIDHYKVDFDEAVDDSTASISSKWSVNGYSNLALDTSLSADSQDNDDVIYISFDESGSADTDATPELTVTGATLQDASTNGNVLPDVSSEQVSESDGAAPSIFSASTKDTSNDGNVDKITVTMSEAIDDSAAGDITDSSNDEFSVSAGNVDTVQTGSQDDSTVELLVSGFTGTSVTPTVTQKASAISDGSNTNSDAPSVTASDAAAPVVTSAAYRDSTGDGTIDEVDVTFSEALSSYSYTDSDWGVTANGFSSFDVTGTSGSSTKTITLTASAPSGVTGVSSEPQIDVVADAVSASSGTNTGSDTRSTDVTMTDEAAPVISDAAWNDQDDDGKIDQVTTSFTESVDIGDSSGDTFDALDIVDSSGTSHAIDSADYSASGASSQTFNFVNDQISTTAISGLQLDYKGSSGTDYIVAAGGSDGTQYEEISTSDVSDVALANTDNAEPTVDTLTYSAGTNTNKETLKVGFSEDITSVGGTGDYTIKWADDGSFGDSDQRTITADQVSDGTGSNVALTIPDQSQQTDTGGRFRVTVTGTSSVKDTNTNTVNTNNDKATSSTVNEFDTTKPTVSTFTTKDRDADGSVDAVNVDFSEPVQESTIEAGDFQVGSSNTAANSVAADAYGESDGSNSDLSKVQIQFAQDSNEISGTGVKNVDYESGNSGTIKDTAGNTLADIKDRSATDGAAPVAVSGTYTDTGKNGKVDQATLTFSEDIKSSSTLEAGDFAVSGTDSGVLGSTSVSNPTFSTSDTVQVDLTEGSGQDTSLTISLDYTDQGSSNSITDGSNPAADTSSSLSDMAAPSFKSVTTVDSDTNGKVDSLKVTFTEAVADGSVETADLSIGTANSLSGSVGSTVSGNSDGDSTVTVGISEGSSFDTDATPTLSYTSTEGSSTKIADTSSNSNQMKDQTSSAATDGAAPVVTETVTKDSDNNGDIGEVQIKFSEAVNLNDGGSNGIPGLTLDNSNMAIKDSDYTNGNSVTVDLKSEVEGTSATTGVSYSQSNGDVKDQSSSNHELLESVDQVTKTDGAAPVLLHSEIDNAASTSSVTYVDLTFTEKVTAEDNSNIQLENDPGILEFSSGQTGETVQAVYNADSDGDGDYQQAVMETGDEPEVKSFPGVSDGINKAKNSLGKDVNTFRMRLESGENLVSFPIVQGGKPVSEVTSGLGDSVNTVWTYSNGQWKEIYTGETSDNSFKGGRGYLFNMASSDTLAVNVDHEYQTVNGSEPASMDLSSDWTLFGTSQEFDNSNALSSVDKDFKACDKNLNSVSELETGVGYWVTRTDDGTWTPTCS